jgi:uncharacterized protein
MLVKRPFFESLIEEAWKQKTIIWLMGVRRVGKTSLCTSLANVEYFDCELPRVRQLMADPEQFLTSKQGKRIILDEIHRLDNPSELLKIAADHYPTISIIATGSSTLGASKKFRDTLTGRKREIWLTPLLLEELAAFGNQDLRHRFLCGGLPSFFTQSQPPEKDFQEWIDAYWAKDIQELFSVGKRSSFQKCAELLLAHSGSQYEATRYATRCEISRATVANYLAVLQETFVVQVVRPFSKYKPNEIVLMPRVYGFDTGFVCYAKGWRELHETDLGLLWEHCVLNEIQAHLQTRSVHYWRDKKGHEVDFVLPSRSGSVVAVECKYTSNAHLDEIGTNIEAFRKLHPEGENFVVASDIDRPFERTYKNITLSFVSSQELTTRLKKIPL